MHQPDCSTDAASSDDSAVALSRIGWGDSSDIVTAVALGSDSSGHTSYSIAFAVPVTSATTATAPDTTITGARTSERHSSSQFETFACTMVLTKIMVVIQ